MTRKAGLNRNLIARVGTDFSIWLYHKRDYEDVWRLHREGVMQTTPEYPETVPDYESDLPDIEGTYLTDGSNFWVASGPTGLVAMAAVQRVDDDTGRLRRMRVTESARRRGLAKALLRTARDFCRDSGYVRIVLDTTEHQTAAQALYEGEGFRKTGERMIGPFRVFDYVKDLA